MLCKEFATEEAAKDELLILNRFLGDELDVRRCDEDGDQMVVSCAVWDEEKNGYVEA